MGQAAAAAPRVTVKIEDKCPAEAFTAPKSIFALVIPFLLNKVYTGLTGAIRDAGKADTKTFDGETDFNLYVVKGPNTDRHLEPYYLGKCIVIYSDGEEGSNAAACEAIATSLREPPKARPGLGLSPNEAKNICGAFKFSKFPSTYYEGLIVPRLDLTAFRIESKFYFKQSSLSGKSGYQDTVYTIAVNGPSKDASDQTLALATLGMGKVPDLTIWRTKDFTAKTVPGFESKLIKTIGLAEASQGAYAEAYGSDGKKDTSKNTPPSEFMPVAIKAVIAETKDENKFLTGLADFLEKNQKDIVDSIDPAKRAEAAKTAMNAADALQKEVYAKKIALLAAESVWQSKKSSAEKETAQLQCKSALLDYNKALRDMGLSAATSYCN